MVTVPVECNKGYLVFNKEGHGCVVCSLKQLYTQTSCQWNMLNMSHVKHILANGAAHVFRMGGVNGTARLHV